MDNKYQHKNLFGSMIRNNKKEMGDKRPDFIGSCNIEGRDIQVAGWFGLTKTAKEKIDLKFTIEGGEYITNGEANKISMPTPKSDPLADDDIPF